MRRVEPGHALVPLLLAAEHADEHDRLLQIGDVSTPVTVTNPIRGSFSSSSASDRTCRSDSLTLRIRSAMDLP